MDKFCVTSAIALFCIGSADATDLQHNPFERPVTTTESAVPGSDSPAGTEQELSLGGVVLAGSSSVATVNGKIYRLGRAVNGMELEAVDEDGATFIRNGVRIRLELEEPQMDDSNEES